MGGIRPFFICNQVKSILQKTQEIFIRGKIEDTEGHSTITSLSSQLSLQTRAVLSSGFNLEYSLLLIVICKPPVTN